MKRNDMNKNLFLIDGHACVYKYYYAYLKKPLYTSYGQDTSVVYGMCNLIKILFIGFDVTHIGVIFDPPGGSWRKRLYPQYKATRKKPDDISEHIALTYDTLNKWGIYTSAFEDLEADDVIGAIAKKAENLGFTVKIVTKDKDYTQLVNNRISLLDLGKSIGKDDVTIIDSKEVKNRFGIYPNQIIDYLSICGDTADNVKGITGIGKKTAAKLLSEYDDINGIYRNLDKLTKGQKEKFENGKESLNLAHKLVTLITDVELPINIETDLRRPPNTNNNIIELFSQLEFNTIIRDLTKN